VYYNLKLSIFSLQFLLNYFHCYFFVINFTRLNNMDCEYFSYELELILKFGVQLRQVETVNKSLERALLTKGLLGGGSKNFILKIWKMNTKENLRF